METKKKIHGMGFIKFLLAFFRIVFLISVVGLMLTILVKGVGMFTNSEPLKTTLPVIFSITKNSHLLDLGGDSISNLKMNWGMGLVSTSTLPRSFDLLFFLTRLLSVSCGLIFIRLIISILETVEFGDFLIRKNSIRLRWIALLGFTYIFLFSVELAISHFYLSKIVDLPGFNIRSVFYYSYISNGWIFICLFLLVLSEVFRVGALVKKEADLTI